MKIAQWINCCVVLIWLWDKSAKIVQEKLGCVFYALTTWPPQQWLHSGKRKSIISLSVHNISAFLTGNFGAFESGHEIQKLDRERWWTEGHFVIIAVVHSSKWISKREYGYELIVLLGKLHVYSSQASLYF